uniref:Protein TIFY n=1 Tax=Taraxacum kok-saghyz TaxID=333970 RepID=A0A8G1EHN8_TARKO|nr:jasmonate ZIM-domain protein 7 [Taraxacum kok-saghyz]
MSASSEIVDSGRFSGQITPSRALDKSNFSQTCNLFSQYLKENATFPDLTLGRRTTPSTPTMNLFPIAEKTPRSAAVQPQTTAGQTQSTPMTIFYNGQVMVFNDLSPEKVKEILMIAGKGVPQKPTKPEELSNTIVHDSIKIQRSQPVVADLPIARKASLARFLEKRKDRITARSPYQTQGESKQEDSKTWLGLGAQSNVQFQQR